METPNPTPEFVPATNPPPQDDRSYTRLHSFGIKSGLSIEAVQLKFTQSRRRSVYGTIYINTQYYRVHTLYHRPSEDTAETMSPPSGGPLTLCGPNYFLYEDGPTALYVDLSEVGEELPFFRARVPLPSGERGAFSVESPGKEATLIIHMTPISPCTLTDISLELSHPQGRHGLWFVSGSVVAIQNLRTPPDGEKAEGRVCLLKRHEDDPMRVQCHEEAAIKLDLDREVFHAPLWFEKSYIKKRAKLDRAAGDPDDGIHPEARYHLGDGSYLSVEVDLKLVHKASVDKYYLVRETLHYQFKSSDVHQTSFRACLRPRLLCDDGESESEIEVAVTLRPFLDTMTHMGGEPYEEEMLLYEPSSDCESEDHIESSSDEEESSSDEEESKKTITKEP